MTETAGYPVPPAIWAMEPRRHQVIEASAGTGKTHMLERRVVDLVLRGGATIDQILLVTFTEKATAELRRRVRALLAEVVAARGGPAEDEPHWRIDRDARQALASAIGGFDGAAIHTIHGFCHRVLQSTAFDGQRRFRQTQVASETALRDAFTACLRDTLSVDGSARVLLEAWLGLGRRLDDLARAMGEVMRLGGRVARPYEPERVDAALAAFAAAIAGLGGCERLNAALRAGRMHPNTANAAERRARALASAAARRQAGCELPLLLDEIDEQAGELASKLGGAGGLASLAAAAAALARAATSLQAAVVATFLPIVRERLEREKAERGQFDYGDMLELVWRALSGPRGDELAARLRARHPFALIDEFQDTDDVQWSIFRRLYLETPGDERGAWLSVVGDPKQAIYGFRGADVHTYLAARREMLAAGAQETYLDVCYRASGGLVAAVNGVLADAAFVDPFFSGGIEYRAVRAAPAGASGGQVAVDGRGREVEPLCVFHVPDAAQLDAASLRARLADCMVGEIAAVVGAAGDDHRLWLRGRADGSGERRPIGPGDIFVLTRTTAESREMAERLRRIGIPCALYQQEGLLQSEEAAEVRDLLAAVAAPRDLSARLRAWQSRFFAVPLAELTALAAAGESHPLVQRLFEWKALADRLDYEALFPRILDETRLVEREIALAPGERALTNFLHLFELLLDEMLAARCDLVELVRRLGRWMDETVGSDERNVQRLESERDAVQIMTVHRAKGLEAPVVFLYGGMGQPPYRAVQAFHQDGQRRVHVGRVRDPELAAAIDAEERGENERLLYVALTRASARLYLSSWPIGAQRRAPGSLSDLLNPRLLPLAKGAGAAVVATIEATGERIEPPRAAPSALADFRPRLDEGGDEAGDGALARALRRQRGPVTTSYTRLVQAELVDAQDAALPFDLGEPLSATPDGDAADRPGGAAPLPAASDAAGGAPSGRRVGIFLHEALEGVPMPSDAESDDFAAWAGRPDVVEVFRRAAERQDLDGRAIEWGQEIVWRGLRQPIDFGGGLVIPGVARASRQQREVDFLFPIADGDAQERGLVRGAIDLVFEYGGRIYWLDWKSDSCPDYAADALARHVAAHYTLQARIYSQALSRMLRIADAADHEARFGGLIYFFLRGAAVHVERPGFAELSESARALAESLP